VIVSFDVPPATPAVFGFTQGQYLTLRKEIDGPGPAPFLFHLRRRRRRRAARGRAQGGGRRVLQLDQRAPEAGRHHQRHGAAGPLLRAHRAAGAAATTWASPGGSGITPILSIMKTVLAREPASRFTLIYGNRKLRSTMFKEELDDLKDKYLSRVVMHHVFSDEHTDAGHPHGR
jgi:ring-1,2-phenylacetyl-CoA epoxidase subunit PaaE